MLKASFTYQFDLNGELGNFGLTEENRITEKEFEEAYFWIDNLTRPTLHASISGMVDESEDLDFRN